MRTEEEIREKLTITEFMMDAHFEHLMDIRMWNPFVSMYWLLKWVLNETHSSGESTNVGV